MGAGKECRRIWQDESEICRVGLACKEKLLEGEEEMAAVNETQLAANQNDAEV